MACGCCSIDFSPAHVQVGTSRQLTHLPCVYWQLTHLPFVYWQLTHLLFVYWQPTHLPFVHWQLTHFVLSMWMAGYFLDTTLLAVEEQMTLNAWFGTSTQQWRLLYRGSRDGFDAQSFHRLCDGKRPTCTIVQVRRG